MGPGKLLGDNLTKCWEVTCDGLVSHPGGVEIFLVASYYRNRRYPTQIFNNFFYKLSPQYPGQTLSYLYFQVGFYIHLTIYQPTQLQTYLELPTLYLHIQRSAGCRLRNGKFNLLSFNVAMFRTRGLRKNTGVKTSYNRQRIILSFG